MILKVILKKGRLRTCHKVIETKETGQSNADCKTNVQERKEKEVIDEHPDETGAECGDQPAFNIVPMLGLSNETQEGKIIRTRSL